jgi:hypothetical protein
MAFSGWWWPEIYVLTAGATPFPLAHLNKRAHISLKPPRADLEGNFAEHYA